MKIEIHRLTPERLDDYLRFFDHTPHSTNREEHRCYCVCWRGGSDADRDFSSAERRREAAAQYVRDGHIQGYLAYCGGKAIGWVNANTKSDCYECLSWKMFMGSVHKDESSPGIRVKSIFCFAIAPETRGKGIASLLLNRVLEDAQRDGFDFVEAYPNRAFIDTEQDFMGPRKLYEKSGFSIGYEAGEKLVMRKRMGGS